MTSGWGYGNRPSATVTGGGGKASGIELFDIGSRKKLLSGIERNEYKGNGRVVNPATPLDPIRLQPVEAATLQSYPKSFKWVGAKTKQYLQIGNAVPPLLAEAILKGFL